MAEITTSFAGSNVWWTSAEANLEVLKRELTSAGYGGILVEPKSDLAALRSVIESQWSRAHRRLLRPLPRGIAGYQITQETVEGKSLDYSSLMQIQLTNSQVVCSGEKFEALPQEAQDAITLMLNNKFADEKKQVSREQITRILVKILKTDFQAIQLQKNQSFYWVNANHIPAWDKVVRAVETAWKESGSQRGMVLKQNIGVDDDAIRAVSVALREDILHSVELIEDEVTKGDAGKRRLKTLNAQAKSLHSRINEYRSLLGPALEELHQSAERASKSATLAALRGHMA
jgi:hypothetical protein